METGNAALMNRFFTYLGLLPIVLQYIAQAESTGAPGPDKRKRVVTLASRDALRLAGAGYLPPELADPVQIGKLVDTVVGAGNDNAAAEDWCENNPQGENETAEEYSEREAAAVADARVAKREAGYRAAEDRKDNPAGDSPAAGDGERPAARKTATARKGRK